MYEIREGVHPWFTDAGPELIRRYALMRLRKQRESGKSLADCTFVYSPVNVVAAQTLAAILNAEQESKDIDTVSGP